MIYSVLRNANSINDPNYGVFLRMKAAATANKQMQLYMFRTMMKRLNRLQEQNVERLVACKKRVEKLQARKQIWSEKAHAAKLRVNTLHIHEIVPSAQQEQDLTAALAKLEALKDQIEMAKKNKADTIKDLNRIHEVMVDLTGLVYDGKGLGSTSYLDYLDDNNENVPPGAESDSAPEP